MSRHGGGGSPGLARHELHRDRWAEQQRVGVGSGRRAGPKAAMVMGASEQGLFCIVAEAAG